MIAERNKQRHTGFEMCQLPVGIKIVLQCVDPSAEAVFASNVHCTERATS